MECGICGEPLVGLALRWPTGELACPRAVCVCTMVVKTRSDDQVRVLVGANGIPYLEPPRA